MLALALIAVGVGLWLNARPDDYGLFVFAGAIVGGGGLLMFLSALRRGNRWAEGPKNWPGGGFPPGGFSS